MWFLKSLLFSMIIIAYLRVEKTRCIGLWAWGVCYYAGVMISSYYGVFNNTVLGMIVDKYYYGQIGINSTRNFVFAGFFVYIGYLIGEYGFPMVLRKNCKLIFCSAFIISVIEMKIISDIPEGGNGEFSF